MTGARADHYGIAERGKLHALAGDHRRAIACYRLSMRLVASDPALSVCARHYADCALESLERMGALDDAARWCEAALEHYAAQPPTDDLQRKDLASLRERLGCIELKRGRRDAAEAAFADAAEAGDPAPLAEEFLRHLRAGRHLTADFVTNAQKRSGQFCVRRDAVEPERAIDVPDALLFAASPPVSATRATSM